MKSVTVIVPAYNEGVELAGNLAALTDHIALYSAAYRFHYVVVDDGSCDETLEIAQRFAKLRHNVTVVRHDRNYGLGRALRTGFAHADGDFTVVLDADLSYHPSVAMGLLEELDRQGADIAIASPYIRGGSVANVPPLRRILSREANRLLSLAANGRYATFTCMVRAYRTDVIKRIAFKADGMENSAEILLGAIRIGATIIEVPAELRWSAQRRTTHARQKILNILRHTFATARLAFGFRPALWLAVPGLVPGLLPLVVAILLLLHVRSSTLALGTLITVTVQYTSLAVFAGQLGTFFTRTFLKSRKQAALQKTARS